MSFTGRRVVVTGAGTGIGAATAGLFLAAGAEVIAVQNRAPAPHASSRVTMDLSNPDSIAAACDALPPRFDILCNIAGTGADGNTPEDIIAVNFIGTRLFTETLLGRIAPTGCIVNTASVAARYWRRDIERVRALMALPGFGEIAAFWAAAGLDHQQSYHISKAAVVALTMKQANANVRTGPRFNVVSPGFTDTPMLQRAFAVANETVKALAQSNNSINAPEGVAKVVLFLCSDDARVINGADIAADAGLLATINCGEFAL